MNSQNTATVLRRGAIHCARPIVLALCRGRNKLRPYIFAVASLLLVASNAAHADVLIDPTRPANAPTKSVTATAHSVDPIVRVTAIFQTGDRRVAVLDDRVVKAGDRIGDIVVQEVLTDGVRYVRAGRVEVVRIPKQAAVVRSATKDSAKTVFDRSSP